MFWCLVLEQILIDIWKRFRSGNHILNALTSHSYKSTGSLLCHLEITRQKKLKIFIAVEQICKKICSFHFIQHNNQTKTMQNAKEQEKLLMCPKTEDRPKYHVEAYP
jgi:hypothetical protein